MDIVRKFGLWIIAAVIILAGMVFFFLVVRKAGSELETKVDELAGRRDKLKLHAQRRDGIPNPKWVKKAKRDAERINAQLDNCAEFLAMQPGRCFTRRFYKGERLGVDKLIQGEVEWIEGAFEWTEAYAKHNEELQARISEAGLTNWNIETLRTWEPELPTDEQIVEAQELFWFQKDLADVLTDLVEQEFAELLKPPSEKPDAFPQKPSDLVITRIPPESTDLDVPLRALPVAKLQAVAEAILLNDEQQDLATIFDTYLKYEEESKKDFSWVGVLRMTMDDAQRPFLDSLVRDPEDLFNRWRFYNFVMELRSVRYRSDVADLLENHGFEEVAESIRKMSSEERPRLVEAIHDWNRTRLAQTIAAVVCINDEKDYRTIRDNHASPIAELVSLTITPPRGQGMPGPGEHIRGRAEDAGYPGGRSAPPGGAAGRMGPAGSRPGRSGRPVGARAGRGTPSAGRRTSARMKEPWRIWSFTMNVKIEYERIPVLVRRLISNSWRYRITIRSVEPVPGSRPVSQELGRRSTPPTGRGARPTPPAAAAPRGRPPGVMPRTRAGRAPARTSLIASGTRAAPMLEELEELHNYVSVDITGEAYQFRPLREQIAKAKKAAAPAESKPAPKPGARPPTKPKPEPEAEPKPRPEAARTGAPKEGR